LLTSLVSAFYYLRVIVKMYFQSGEVAAHKGLLLRVIAVILALLVVGLAFMPGILFNLAGAGIIAGA